MTQPIPLRKVGRRVVEILLWCGAGLGTVSVLTALAAVIFGIVPLVFTSGSMSPEIPSGSLGLARTVAAKELRVGDVVSVTAANQTRVTHRVVATEEQSGQVALTLQGDTNPSPDQESYLVEEADRVFFSVPHLGLAIAFLTSPWAMFVGGLAAAALLFWAFHRQPNSDAGTGGGLQQPEMLARAPRKHRADRAKRRTSATLLAVGIPTLLMVTTNAGTAAYWTDEATVTTSGIATHRVMQPGELTCSEGTTVEQLNSILVSTVSVDSRYKYWASVHTAAMGGTSLAFKTTNPRALTMTPPRLRFTKADLPDLSQGITYYLRIHSRINVPGAKTWESVEYRRQPFSWDGQKLKCGTASPPSTTFKSPTQGSASTKAAINAACEQSSGGYGNAYPLACGTVDTGTTAVQYILQRSLGEDKKCWAGNWNLDCSFRDTSRHVNKIKWSVPGDYNSAYGVTSTFTYKLTIKTTKNGFVSEQSITYTVPS